MFSLTDRESFKGVERWNQEVEKYAREDVVKVAIGTNLDLKDKREVEATEMKSFFDSHDVPYFEVSAKTGENVAEAFRTVAKLCYSHYNSDVISRRTVRAAPNDNDNVNPSTEKPDGGCVIC